MIPKTIHFIWIGGKKPRIFRKCIKSWKKFCVGYEIVEWNERNLPLNVDPYSVDCYENKKYAYLSDFFRLWIIYNYGGIYFDIDVELIKPIDNLLKYNLFIGRDEDGRANTGQGFGAVAKCNLVKKMLDEYLGRTLARDDEGNIREETSCYYNNRTMIENGFSENNLTEIKDNIIYFEKIVMDPLLISTKVDIEWKKVISVHHHLGSWIPIKKRIEFKKIRGEKLNFKEFVCLLYDRLKYRFIGTRSLR